MIRGFLVYFSLLLALIVSLPVHLFLFLLGKKDREKAWRLSKKYVKAFFAIELFLSGCKVYVKGLHNLPKDGVALYIGNHRSYFDILIAHNFIPNPVGFIAKKEMEHFPFLNLYMNDIGCLYLDRENIKEGFKTILKGSEHLASGHSMVLFPEGTRNQLDELLPFKEGGYKMAEKAKCPIIPMALTGSDLLLEAYKHNWIRKGKIIIEFGKPIDLEPLSNKERKVALAQIPSIIQQMKDKHQI